MIQIDKQIGTDCGMQYGHPPGTGIRVVQRERQSFPALDRIARQHPFQRMLGCVHHMKIEMAPHFPTGPLASFRLSVHFPLLR